MRFTALALVGLAGCGDLAGLGGAARPLAEIQVRATGDLAAVRPPGSGPARLHAALVWGTQWLSEPFCFLPPASPEAAAVARDGCRDPLGFAPDRVAATVAITPGVAATLPLYDLPAADVMVGDVTARVAYGSVVIYDDVDDSGTLELHRPSRDEGGPPGAADAGPGPAADAGPGGGDASRDVIYGASFVTMTAPDRRVGFREGGFDAASAFYPRGGCAAPAKGFSILSAGGFSIDAALAAALAGKLPAEPAGSCAGAPLDATVVDVALVAPATVHEVGCGIRRTSGAIRYHEPPADGGFLAGRSYACSGFPSFGGDIGPKDGLQQLLVAGPADGTCVSIFHYTLRGCEEDPACATPQWDRTGSPPAWWPCPVPKAAP